MATTFTFFSDPALTTPLAAPVQFAQDKDSPVAVDKVVYFGSAVASRFAQAASDPGIDPIVISVVDANAGTGSPATDVKLALSSVGLDTAVAGAALSLPAQVDSGALGAVEIHIRVLDSTHTVGIKTDLSLASNVLAEFAA